MEHGLTEVKAQRLVIAKVSIALQVKNTANETDDEHEKLLLMKLLVSVVSAEATLSA
jgi:hypothetical protein